jgi:hypoxanthine-DNA glycosylase
MRSRYGSARQEWAIWSNRCPPGRQLARFCSCPFKASDARINRLDDQEGNRMSRVQSFPPIASDKSKVLILGSMPGNTSLNSGQYYAHPRNAFWRIIGELFGAVPSLSYQERVIHLQSAGIALWDSLQACVRRGSPDASITEEVANDFPAFFAKVSAHHARLLQRR